MHLFIIAGTLVFTMLLRVYPLLSCFQQASNGLTNGIVNVPAPIFSPNCHFFAEVTCVAHTKGLICLE